MRILIVSQYFYPENFRINEIAFFLKEKGFDVTVLTSKPNYPEGKFYKGYNFFNKNTEFINGVKIIRVPTFPRLNGGIIGMSLNYLSFIFFGFFIYIFKIKNKYDLIFATLLTPATSLLPMIWIKKRFKTPIILWVLDLWPDSFFANTGFRNKYIDSMIERISNKVYNYSDSILISSRYFEKSIKKRLESNKKFTFFPNWAEPFFYKKIKNDDLDYFIFPKGFNIIFTGNIGDSQGFEDVLEAAKLTSNMSINWILIGDGRKKVWIENQIKILDLKNIYLPGRYPMEVMPYYFSKADSLLITLKKDTVFSNTLPGKFQPYLTSGKPILGNLSGEGLELIKENELGLGCNPGNPEVLANLAIELSLFSGYKLKQIGNNCLELDKTIFRKEMIFETLLEEVESFKLN